MARPHPALINLAAGRPMGGVQDVEALLRSAREHKMQGLLWGVLERGEVSLPRDAEFLLAKWNLQVRARHRSLWRSLEEAVDKLQSIGLEIATAKGVTAEARWYPGPGTRPNVDVDLLMSPSDLSRADEALALFQLDHPLAGHLGFLAEKGHLQSVDVVDGLGNAIDLHFDILKFEVVARQNQVIWDRTVYFDTPNGGRVRVLDPETSLIHFLLHLNKDRFSYLLAMVDVVHLVDQETLDWDFIDRFIRDEGLDTQLYLALDTVFETLQLPAPLHPKPAGWRAIAWRRSWPEPIRLQGDIGRIRFHRRQFLLGMMARGRTADALQRWIRRVFPSRVLLDYYFPGLGGPYLWHLTAGRICSAWRRHKRIKGLERLTIHTGTKTSD